MNPGFIPPQNIYQNYYPGVRQPVYNMPQPPMPPAYNTPPAQNPYPNFNYPPQGYENIQSQKTKAIHEEPAPQEISPEELHPARTTLPQVQPTPAGSSGLLPNEVLNPPPIYDFNGATLYDPYNTKQPEPKYSDLKPDAEKGEKRGGISPLIMGISLMGAGVLTIGALVNKKFFGKKAQLAITQFGQELSNYVAGLKAGNKAFREVRLHFPLSSYTATAGGTDYLPGIQDGRIKDIVNSLIHLNVASLHLTTAGNKTGMRVYADGSLTIEEVNELRNLVTDAALIRRGIYDNNTVVTGLLGKINGISLEEGINGAEIRVNGKGELWHIVEKMSSFFSNLN